ncbi:phosphotransferase family protein [Cucurbitaria berberidis CBS 394.84]|uniref:Phosphotransferase family protein n=1 Tax=Cucurbitaria berberidis CBS 394.84 TaxID=1168544 RepID=A0A9P4L8X5_9PLEO|nr:phosphotransferase family protein [Cucurbitaria berberidis CBS 394.84]KAF1846500.1 phosphotransferase family protein [Cucurbitaria berberidis CBS 394.84]
MALFRKLNSQLVIRSSYRPFPRTITPLRARKPFTESARSLAGHSREQLSELFEYTSGRWLWNDAQKRSERRRVFNVSELKRIAAAAVNRNVQDVVRFEKLAEGGFNRTFLVTMHDGYQFVGRIPYLVTEPKHLVVASEVATMDFLRSHGLPVPKVYSYSTTSENPAGTEYIFMERIRGTKLGDIWFDLPEKARITVVTKLVELESRLFALPFPASGSIYYNKDLKVECNKVDIPVVDSGCASGFCVGPDTRLRLWYGKRLDIQTDRGPYMDSAAVLTAGAKKEIAYLKEFGRPLHPFQRLHREIYNYEKQSPFEHMDSLEKYLQIVPYLTPNGNETLTRPTLRHPDLNPGNIFISDDLEITGLIDWQNSAILPLFLQCGIPNSLQNYGDSVSESLTLPEIPHDFNELSERKQSEQVELLRRRQIHYFYVAMTAKLNPTHYDALNYEFSTLRRKLFDHSGSYWEGDNVTLKADLVNLTKKWSNIVNSCSRNATKPPCPIFFSEDEVSECLRLDAAQVEADEQLKACEDAVGIGSEGWVPAELYDEIKQRERKLKADALEAAESEEERQRLHEHWIFDDFDEEEYL